MKKKISVYLFLAALSLGSAAVAQQQPQQTPAQVELQKEAMALQSKTQLDYNKLRDLVEFQDYLKDLQEMQQLQQQYQAAAVRATKPVEGSQGKPPAPAKK